MGIQINQLQYIMKSEVAASYHLFSSCSEPDTVLSVYISII